VRDSVFGVRLRVREVSVCGIIWTISTTTLRQALTPPAMMGRVNAIFLTANAGARPVGAAIGARRREAVVGATNWRAGSRRPLSYSELPFRTELAPAPNDRLIVVSVSTLVAGDRQQPLLRRHAGLIPISTPEDVKSPDDCVKSVQRIPRRSSYFSSLSGPEDNPQLVRLSAGNSET
jgi:hypothetical protein